MTTTFVGRDRELDTLMSTLAVVRRGSGRLVLVSGEAGIGKSMLVQRFCASAADVTLLWGSCWPGGGAPTYWPWVQVLRAAAAHGGQDTIERLGSCLAPLPLEPTLEYGDGSQVERFALFDAVTQVLHAVAGGGTVVVVLEDLHAGGVANALLLDFVARHSRHVPMLVVGTYRDIDVQLDPDLAPIVAELEAVATTVTLAPFSEREVHQLALAELPDVRPAFVAEVRDRTEGNPLFVAQVLGELRQNPGARIEARVPAALRQVVRRRVEWAASHGDVPDFLPVAAVTGTEIDLALLESLLDAPAAALGAAAEAASDAGLLRSTPRGYVFAHALVRDAVYGDLKPAQRSAWHLKVARELAARDRHPALVAHHFLEAGPAGGADEAADYAIRAGDLAMATLAAEDAVEHYRQALRALERSSHDRSRERCGVLISLGAALIASGRLQEVRPAAETATALAGQLGDAELLSEAALLASEHLHFNAVDAAAISLLRRADAAWGGMPSPLRARVLARLAVVVANTDRVAAEHAAELAESVAAQIDDPAALATALSGRLHAEWGRHEPAVALESARRIQALVPESVDGHLWCAVFALENGDLELASRAVAEVDRLASDPRRPTVRHLALSRRATLAIVRGHLDKALALSLEAWELGRRCGLPDADAVVWCPLFLIWKRRGLEPELAEQMEQIVRDLAERSPLRMVHEAAVVQIFLARGETESARRSYDSLVALVPTLAHDMVRVFSLALLAEDCMAFADTDSAGLLYDALLPYADRFAVAAGAVACTGSVHRPLAGLATLLGHHDAAREHLAAAAAAHQRAGAYWDDGPGSSDSISIEREGAVWAIRQGRSCCGSLTPADSATSRSSCAIRDARFRRCSW
jgi:tetratricopeptide (TPR) repeat protein